MRILFLSDNFYPETNAAASRVFERARFWVDSGHQVTVVTSCPNFPEGKPYEGYENRWRFVEHIDGIRVVRTKTYMAANVGVAKRMIDFTSFMITSFFVSLFEKSPDVVVATSPQFFTAISGWMVSVVKRRPYGLEIADLWPESIRAVDALKASVFLDVMEKVELFLYRRASFVIALTNSIRRNMTARGIQPDKIHTVINGANTDFFKPNENKDEELVRSLGLHEKFVVGYLGTFGMAHNLENLLDAAERLRMENNSSVHFLIVGAGAEKETLKQVISQKNLVNVTMLDRQPKSEIQRYWSVCDLSLVHLKNSTTFKSVIPSKIFEAMATGVPILYCGPASDGSDIVIKEDVGVQIESGDPEALKKEIIRLSSSRDQLKTFRSNQLSSVQRYTRRRQAEHFIEVIAEHVNQPTTVRQPAKS